jgi:hypothetical protein
VHQVQASETGSAQVIVVSIAIAIASASGADSGSDDGVTVGTRRFDQNWHADAQLQVHPLSKSK